MSDFDRDTREAARIIRDGTVADLAAFAARGAEEEARQAAEAARVSRCKSTLPIAATSIPCDRPSGHDGDHRYSLPPGDYLALFD